MHEVDWRSIRLLVDLQCCQTPGSAGRGVGRYSTSLFRQLAEACAPRDLFALEAAYLPAVELPSNFRRERVIRVDPLPDWNVERDFRGGERDSLDGALYGSVCTTVQADVIHVSHVFEGLHDRIALPPVSGVGPGQVLSATLYDLIPLRFREHYFSNQIFERWYRHRLQWLQQADLLLSISESSRRDAIDLVGVDADRIVTIHGGISEHFKPAPDLAAAKLRLRAKYGISRNGYVLYTSGDEYRKNLEGAIRGYAALPGELRRDRHLIVICALGSERRQVLEACAMKSGLSHDDVLFLGFVPEEDLVAFYGTCDLFFFPSLYEGLGLPVIEAMACGAPVIGGDNSAIRETIGRPDALFDAGDPVAIARSIQRILAEPDFAKDLRRHGLARSKEFTWRRSAEIALDAFDEVLQRKRMAGCHGARAGWLPRKRIAMFTPLPPCKSGIADYNARFLPYLAEHLDIDLYIDDYEVTHTTLTSAFRIFSARDFPGSASVYDAVLYEFGNSEFHAHMLPMLAEFPGIVGLHDAFLSGLMGYVEFSLRDEDRYAKEMLYAHAGLARRYLAPARSAPDANYAAMVELPCSKRVLDQAIGLISHSPFNLKIARQFYPEGWLAPYRIIPQMMSIAEPWSEARRLAARAELGFGHDDFIVATFGHVAWTKCGDRILDAFLRSELSRDRRCRLVFVGELAKDDFGRGIDETIRRSGLAERIKVTGFASRENYECYLHIVDVAVQLRTKSRGGTPRGVLDALAFGLPVIVNSEASHEDYPDDVVLKISSDPTSEDIASALAALRGDRSRRVDLAKRGTHYLREQHDPNICAAQYAAAIHEFAARDFLRRTPSHVRTLAPHLAGCPDQAAASRMAAKFLHTRPVPSFERPRLFIDVSHIARGDHRTGIPRIVKETVGAAYCRQRPGFEAIAVERVDDRLFVSARWLNERGLLLPHEVAGKKEPIAFRPGDRLLMLDSSWAQYSDFGPAFANARAARVPITTAVYDLLPITLPPGHIVDGGKEWFEGWLRSAIAASDGLVCISKAAADELISYIECHDLGRKGLKVGYWHLGSNLPVRGDVPKGSSVFRASATPYFLMVGTIEPRKSHALALDAFERLWADGVELNLVVAGKSGWMTDDLLARIRSHPLLNKRLFLVERPSDAEVSHLYAKARALLFLSKGEGFGLPLVEAAHYGTPILCSDIPVFREIAGPHATYVGHADPAALVEEMADWCRRYQTGEIPKSSNMPRLTWEESTEALINVVLGGNWYWRT